MTDSKLQSPSYPFMTIQVSPQGMVVTIVSSQFEAQKIVVPTENCINFCAEFIPTLPKGTQQDLIRSIHDANKTNADIARAIKPVLRRA
jgi:hypothetical protein